MGTAILTGVAICNRHLKCANTNRATRKIVKLRLKTAARLEKKESYKHALPHFQQPGQAYFVTWNLKDAVPKKALKRYSDELKVLGAAICNRRKNTRLKTAPPEPGFKNVCLKIRHFISLTSLQVVQMAEKDFAGLLVVQV
jgi:hypothetical protein